MMIGGIEYVKLVRSDLWHPLNDPSWIDHLNGLDCLLVCPLHSPSFSLSHSPIILGGIIFLCPYLIRFITSISIYIDDGRPTGVPHLLLRPSSSTSSTWVSRPTETNLWPHDHHHHHHHYRGRSSAAWIYENELTKTVKMIAQLNDWSMGLR